jgi:NifU-like protein involved in Fe-S cluster formation
VNYNRLTRHHFATAVNAGVLSGPDTRRGAAGSRAEGTWVQFDVQIDVGRREGRLGAVRFLAYACPHVIAVSDWIAQLAIGLEAKAALPESVSSLRHRFGVPIEKLGRLLIVEDAWIAAISPPNP